MEQQGLRNQLLLGQAEPNSDHDHNLVGRDQQELLEDDVEDQDDETFGPMSKG